MNPQVKVIIYNDLDGLHNLQKQINKIAARHKIIRLQFHTAQIVPGDFQSVTPVEEVFVTYAK